MHSRLTQTEIEAILIVPTTPTLTQLDNTLRMFITFTAVYHGMSLSITVNPESLTDNAQDTYLQSPPHMLHAIDMLLHSELFTYHDARMVGIMMVDAQEVSSTCDDSRQRIDPIRTHIHMSFIYSIISCKNTANAILRYLDHIGNGINCCQH